MIKIEQGELFVCGPEHIELIESVFQKEAFYKFRASGFSMCPFIKSDDTLTLAPIHKHKVSLGDVVAFKRHDNGCLVIHRVVGKKGAFYIIKGDNVLKVDGLIPKENIFGYVSAIERNGKRIYLGLGPEKFIIALFSRWTGIFILLNFIWKVLRQGTSKVLK